MSDTIATATLDECIENAIGVHEYFWQTYNANEPESEKLAIQALITNMLREVSLESARKLTAEMIRQYIVDIKSDLDDTPALP